MLNYFDSKVNSEVICYASPYGLSAILTQYYKDKNKKGVVDYASRSLTEKEQGYSQIEREALAILFGCTISQVYLLGKHFKIMTDHKPLLYC